LKTGQIKDYLAGIGNFRHEKEDYCNRALAQVSCRGSIQLPSKTSFASGVILSGAKAFLSFFFNGPSVSLLPENCDFREIGVIILFPGQIEDYLAGIGNFRHDKEDYCNRALAQFSCKGSIQVPGKTSFVPGVILSGATAFLSFFFTRPGRCHCFRRIAISVKSVLH